MTHSQAQTPQAARPALAPSGTSIDALTGQPEGVTALRGHLTDLQTRLTELNAQRSVLVDHARSSDAGIRGRAENEILSVDLEMASVRARIASMQSQLSQDGGTGTLVPPPPPPATSWFDRIDPDAITAVFVLTALAVLIPLSIGIARRLWRKPAPPVSLLEDKISPRLDRLEQAVDAIAIEVERISEGQRFVAKVLTERSPVAQAAAASTASDGAALGDAKPFLALGAGPMEPIRAAERQAVKQSVTPH